ncbi:MAG: cysteine--tRNA ligase [Candidatus Levybacteria bacterium]|nr:cysteine--tRNA ligase [Candidatus Levybacteria bacterium]
MLKLYNTMTKGLEEFVPQDPSRITMYTCGPTVYDHMHIGNLRTFVFSDILFRVLRYNHFRVSAVQNITDIDDKIIKRAMQRQTTITEIAKEYTDFFLQDIRKLNINPKNLKEQPRATEYVGKMIDYIKVLIAKGFAYTEKDGSVYFDISKFEKYGKLSGVEKRELKTGTRMLSDEYTKEDVQDFSLWKSVGEKEVGYESPWGRGRPGWHIECSVMSQTILGNKLDIHAGGIDLIFPHHENEIAQSEAMTGESPFVKYWVHGAHILVDGKKMSKSLHNFYTLSDLEEKNFHALSLRYLYLQTHYRQEMNFTFESLTAAQNALEKLWSQVAVYEASSSAPIKEYEEKFLKALNDDLNMPKALSLVWEVIKSNYKPEEKYATLLNFDQILGLSLKEADLLVKVFEKEMPLEVKKLLEDREQLRREKRYKEADKLRDKIIEMGYKVEDN